LKDKNNSNWQIAIVSIVAIVGIMMMFFIGRTGTIGSPGSVSTSLSSETGSNFAGQVALIDPELTPRELCMEECEYFCEGEYGCGDGVIDEGEECDAGALGGKTCRRLGFYKGILSCAEDCTFSTERCSNCGNRQVEEGEVCDRTNLAGNSCASLGFTGGTLRCSSDCNSFITTRCTGAASIHIPPPTPPSNCGNGVLDPDEECDASSTTNPFGFASCASYGGDKWSGDLICVECRAIDTSRCVLCGNNIREGSEVCDGTDVGGNTCRSLGYSGGTITCSYTCLGYTGCYIGKYDLEPI